MTAFRTLSDLSQAGRRVLVRVDLNVPIENGAVSDATRLERVLPTIRELADGGARVVLLSHFGRPKGRSAKDSLRPVAEALGGLLGRPVAFADDCIGAPAEAAVSALADGGVLVLENTRFHAGEEANDPAFVAALARLGDAYVNDAFSAAHRAHASTEGLARALPAYAGRAMQAELEALEAALGAPRRPVLAIVGGAKVSTKLGVLEHLAARVDALVVGGGMANTFLVAEGVDVGRSLAEPDLAPTARRVLDGGGAALVPVRDVVAAKEFRPDPPTRTVDARAVAPDEMILDFGPASVAAICEAVDRAATVLWNGPLGAFETPPFDAATVAVARHVAARTKAGALVSVAGGGDTVAALNRAGAAGDFTYVSTAGGAFLEWMEGKLLPGVEALVAAARG